MYFDYLECIIIPFNPTVYMKFHVVKEYDITEVARMV
jgi:hypothetical protein